MNKLDVYGAQAIGTGYAGVYTAPTNGLIVQGDVGIGTKNPLGYALDVNGTVAATKFVGSGAGLTGIGTASISGVIPIVNGGTNASSQTTNGVAYFDGTAITTGTSFVYTGGNVGIGTASSGAKLEVNGNSQLDGQVTIPATASSAFYNQGTGIAQIVLNSGGSSYGTIQNDAANKWSLGYNTTGTSVLGTPVLTWNSSGTVGIGTTAPQSELQVYGGEVQVGDSGNSCTSANAGAIRYSGGTAYVCDGANWDAFGGSSGGALPSSGQYRCLGRQQLERADGDTHDGHRQCRDVGIADTDRNSDGGILDLERHCRNRHGCAGIVAERLWRRDYGHAGQPRHNQHGRRRPDQHHGGDVECEPVLPARAFRRAGLENHLNRREPAGRYDRRIATADRRPQPLWQSYVEQRGQWRQLQSADDVDQRGVCRHRDGEPFEHF